MDCIDCKFHTKVHQLRWLLNAKQVAEAMCVNIKFVRELVLEIIKMLVFCQEFVLDQSRIASSQNNNMSNG